MRFCSLGSGSTGNATLVEAASGGRVSRLLIDCGLSLRELARRLAQHGLAPDDLDAVFITHEHSDHVGCALTLLRRHGVSIWTSEGTWRSMRRDPAVDDRLLDGVSLARDGETIALGALCIEPFSVPHDATEPLQLSCTDGQVRLGVLTDLGEPTPAVIARLRGCEALLLECNHDAQMLADGPYPYFLKRRVGGPRGHLANAQSAQLLSELRHGGLRHVVAAHLSQKNNTPQLAAQALAQVLGTRADDIVVADALNGSPWLDVA